MFERYVDVDFPGYKNLVVCVMLFRSKFEINYKSKVTMFNFSDSGSDWFDYINKNYLKPYNINIIRRNV